MGENFVEKIVKSWSMTDSFVNHTQDLVKWIEQLNMTTEVEINECSINDSNFWFYDDYNGEVLNRKRSFFSIKGMRYFVNKEFITEQPIIIQPEIGYLGIICTFFDGVLHFLMQAKVEPGNVNCVQLSPTLQATKSNFTRAHGGKMPMYLDYFENVDRYKIIYDQIQPEQGTRFVHKRNRNMIILVEEPIEIYPSYKWMTLGQIKQFMEIDNLVNMDTRTVLSGLPFFSTQLTAGAKEKMEYMFNDQALFNSIFMTDPTQNLSNILHKLNDFKMFHDVALVNIPLNQLVDWEINEYGITSKKQADFMVRYYDIKISSREVQSWTQPLFKAIGSAVFGLLTRKKNGVREFLVKISPELGVFDKVELGPSIKWEASHYLYNDDEVGQVFRTHLENNKNVMRNVMLSEEGGRFYHEQNRNVIIEIDENELENIPKEYMWATYLELTMLIYTSNCLDIQLRNLLSLLKI